MLEHGFHKKWNKIDREKNDYILNLPKPHHKQYYILAERRRRKCIEDKNEEEDLNNSLNQLDSECNINKQHFFFNKLKKCMGIGGAFFNNDVTQFLTSIERRRPGLLDGLPDLGIMEDGDHPWRKDWRKGRKRNAK